MNKLNILYEDNHVIVVQKLPGILSQSDITGGDDLLSMVKEYIKVKYEKQGDAYIGLVHRLDRNVGGIMVFARTSKAAKRLNEQIRKHEFNKTYIAYVKGKIESKKATLINYIYKDEKLRKGIITDKESDKAKEAILNYEVIDYVNNNTLVKINLVTGRFHQIRLQFSHINHPIIGDMKYGNEKNDNLYLYAYKLAFYHPVTKELLTFKLLPKWRELEDEAIIHRL